MKDKVRETELVGGYNGGGGGVGGINDYWERMEGRV